MGYLMGYPVGHSQIYLFFLIKIKNDKHKKNKLKINFLLIYQLLMAVLKKVGGCAGLIYYLCSQAET